MQSDIFVAREVKKQRKQWGLEHDLKHGSGFLMEIAQIFACPNRPDDSLNYGDEWWFSLWDKHKDNPIRRLAISAAFAHAAIECLVYEDGLKTVPKD